MRQFKLGSEEPSGSPNIAGRTKEKVMRNWRLITVLSFIVVIAFALRAFFAYGVSVADGYALSGGSDAAYHVRVIEYIMANGSHLVNDAAMNYPYGETNMNPPLMDWIIAVIAKIVSLFGVSSAAAAAGTLIWSTAILGALTCIPVYRLAKEMFSSKAGIIAALLYAVCAAAISQTVLSNGTEAAFYGFFFVIMLRCLYKAVKKCSPDVPDRQGSFGDYARGVYNINKPALKYALFAGILLAVVELSWNGFRPIVMMIALMMIIQAAMDRVRYKDPTSAALMFASVLVISTIISAPVYALCGLWGLAYSGTFFLVLISIAVTMVITETKKRPWMFVFPILIVSVAALFAVLWFAVPGTFSNIVGGNSIYGDPLFAALADMNSGVRLSEAAGYYGWLTMWLPYLLAAMMICRFKDNLASASKTFVMMWLIAMLLIGWSGSSNVYLAVPAYAVGGGAVIEWALGKAKLTEYAAGFKGIGFHVKAFLKKMVQPAPFLTILASVLLLAAPNAVYAIDAGVSSNQKTNSPSSVTDYAGAFGYYVKNDDWKMNDVWNEYSSKPAEGSLVSWLDYSAEAVSKGGFDAVAGSNGSGAAAASNILLSSGNGSYAAMAIRIIVYEGIDKFESFMNDAAPGGLGLSSDEYKELKNILQNPGDYKDRILKDPNTYGSFDASLTDENAMYIASVEYLTNGVKGGKGLTPTECVRLYDHVCGMSDKDIRYIAVSRGMFPISYGDGSVFSTIAYLNNYHLDSSGAPADFYTMDTYSGTYDYTDKLYETLLWKAYIGPSPSDLGYTSPILMLNAFAASDGSENTRPQPGFGLANYSVGYWKVLYNTDSEAAQDSGGWEEMDAFEAMRIQDDKIAAGEEAGLINFMSGLPVVLEYTHTDETKRVSGTVTSGTEGVSSVRVTLFDEKGMQWATVFTDENGAYEMYIPFESGKIVFYAGSDTMKGGLAVRTIEFTSGDPPASVIDVSVDTFSLDGEIYYADVDESSLDLLEGDLTAYAEGTVHGTQAAPAAFNNGTFAFSGLIPDKYTITIKDANENTVATGTYGPFLGKGGNVQVRMFLTSATIRISVTNEAGDPINGYVKLQNTDEPFSIVAETENGAAEAKVVPGIYKAILVTDETGDTESDTAFFGPEVKVASGGSVSLTAKAQPYAEVTFSGITGNISMSASNGAYSTSTVLSPENDLIRLPVGLGISTYEFSFRYINGIDGKEWMCWDVLHLEDTSAETMNVGGLMGAQHRSGETFEFSRTIVSSKGAAVAGNAVFYPASDGVPLVSASSTEDGKVSARLPAGDYYLYISSTDTSVKEAYLEKITVSGQSRGGTIGLEAGKTMTVNMYYSNNGSLGIPYAGIDVIESGRNITIKTSSNENGVLSFVVPDGDYSFRADRTIGGYTMAGTDIGGKVTQNASVSSNSITATFRTPGPVMYDSTGGIVLNYIDPADPENKIAVPAGTEVKVKMRPYYSTEATFEVGANGVLDLKNYSLPVGTYDVDVARYTDGKSTGYFYDGEMTLRVSGGTGPLEITIEKMDMVTLEGLKETDTISVKTLDDTAGKYYSDTLNKDTGEQRYYFEDGKEFQVTVKGEDGKIWYYYHAAGATETVPGEGISAAAATEEFITVKGFAGYPSAGIVEITWGGTKITADVSETGMYEANIPISVQSAAFSSMLGKYTDGDAAVYSYSTKTPKTVTKDILDSGRVNLLATGEAEAEKEALAADHAIISASEDRSVTFSVTVNGNAYRSLFLSGGAGWDDIRFYSDPGLADEIDHINGAYADPDMQDVTFYAKAIYKAGEAADSPNLSVIFKDAAGTDVYTYEANISAAIPSQAAAESEKVTIGRGESDVYGDSEYRFAVVVKNDGLLPCGFRIEPGAAIAPEWEWYLAFTDADGKNVYGNSTGKGGYMEYTASAKSETTVYVKLVIDTADSLPEKLDIKVTSLDTSKVEAGTDTTVSGNAATISIAPSSAELDLDGNGASGPNIFTDAGSIPAIIWAMIALSILAGVLIAWLGMKRGVFARK